MDLTAALLRIAARRPHVLVVPTVGGAAVRLRLEAELTRRGWPLAATPADTDVLVVAGAPGPELTAIVDEVWPQVPAPRSRTTIPDADRVPAALDQAVLLLADAAHQRGAAPVRAGLTSDHDGDHLGHDTGQNDHGGGLGDHADHADQAEHADHTDHGADHHSVDHGGHHDHHGGGMDLPGGRTMADLGPDRDGLTLDQLHVPLGPLLPDWPVGLVLHVTLQGDVIQEATAEVLDREHRQAFWGPDDTAARELDGLARFLAVAGWADAAARARALRDGLLDGDAADDVVERVATLARRVRRSRTLWWLIRGIPAGQADVAALLGQRLDAAEAALRGRHVGPARVAADDLPGLLVGVELAAARLVVAILDPETESAAVAAEVRHG